MSVGTVGHAAGSASSDPGSLHFRFLLDNDYATSAGAFSADGTLVRTLWSNQRHAAGRHEAVWDGRDDDGRAVSADGEYEIRVLTHNVIYTWDGVIGNTSTDTTSPHHHDGPYFFNDLVVSGDRAFFTVTTEGAIPTMRYFRLDAPQSWLARPGIPMSHAATLGLIAADDERVYWARDASPWKHTWGKGGDQAFVVATDRDLSREIVFEAGTETCVEWVREQCYRDGEKDARIRSAIDVVTDFREDPATPQFEGARNNVTGIAVQADGPLLFVAHGRLDPARIHVLDKRSGRLLARVPLAGVGRLVVGPGAQDIWAIHDGDRGRVVSRLRVGSAPGFALSLVRTLAGIAAPIALALTPDGKQIVIADGGASQQLKAFDTMTGEALWHVGRQGGYRENGPQISTDKLSFNRYAGSGRDISRIEQTVLSFAADGSFWVGDTGLSRLLEFDAGRRYVDQIAFAPISYNVVVDRNDPSRVFAGHREYSVDYARPIGSSWKLVRYFGDSLPVSGAYHGLTTAGFIDVATLRNGRTYGLLRGRDGVEVVEIPATGDLRHFPTILRPSVYMNEAGDLYGSRPDATGGVEVWRRPLRGFDEDGVPLWEREQRSANVTRSPRDPRPGGARGSTRERRAAELAPDLHVVFDPLNPDKSEPANDGRFHLAAVRGGTRQWLWRASPAAGQFNLARPDGVFDTSLPWYAGSAVTALRDQIVYNFHGEGWHGAGQANQFLHWYRDGLFIGQFGVPSMRGIPPAAAGMAGNSFSIQLSEVNGTLYLWHNDEHAHAGVHRWRLDGVEWIRELSGRGRVGESIELHPLPASGERTDAEPAPSHLAAQAGTRQVNLTWASSSRGATGVEVQRLQPTYVGPRFERIALLPAGATSFVDADPLPGEPTSYRVRSRLSNGASDYSNHVSLTAGARKVLLESQGFEVQPPEFRHDAGVEARVIADPAAPGNRILHVLARKPPGPQPLRASVRWKASPELYRALNASVGRPRGSRPDIYRVEMRLRLLQSRLGPDSDVSIKVDPGYDLFSSAGRRQSLPRLAPEQRDGVATQLVRVSFNFAALANGAGPDKGLQQYRSTLPGALLVAFPFTLQADGDVIEFLIDDLSISRLDPVDGPA